MDLIRNLGFCLGTGERSGREEVQHGFAGGMEVAGEKSSLFLAVENIILSTSLLWGENCL